MLATKLIWFYLCLVAVSQVISSTRVNTTSPDGKVFISGDHNEVVVSTAGESKIALAQIKSKLESVDNKDKEFSTKLQALDKRMAALDKIQGNLKTMNQTIEALSEKVEKKDKEFSRKLQGLEKRILLVDKIPTKLNTLNQTIETLSKTVEALNKSNAGLIGQVEAMSQRLSGLERKGTHIFFLLSSSQGKNGLTSCGMGKIETGRCILDILNVGYRIK